MNAAMTPWGQGFELLDALTLASAWTATVINFYLAVVTRYTSLGAERMFRRMVAVAFFGIAALLTQRYVQFDGDLPSSPQFDVLFMLLSVGSTGIGIGRIKLLDRGADRIHKRYRRHHHKE